jgi:hypothetical protein
MYSLDVQLLDRYYNILILYIVDWFYCFNSALRHVIKSLSSQTFNFTPFFLSYCFPCLQNQKNSLLRTPPTPMNMLTLNYLGMHLHARHCQYMLTYFFRSEIESDGSKTNGET